MGRQSPRGLIRAGKESWCGKSWLIPPRHTGDNSEQRDPPTDTPSRHDPVPFTLYLDTYTVAHTHTVLQFTSTDLSHKYGENIKSLFVSLDLFFFFCSDFNSNVNHFPPFDF